MSRIFLQLGFIALVFLTIAFVKLSVGVPVRSMVAISLLGLIFFIYPFAVQRALKDGMLVLLAIGYLAIVGVPITFANGGSPSEITRGLIEDYIQPAIIFALVYSTCLICGFRFTSLVIIGTVVVSVFFSLLQFLEFEPVWMVREVISSIQGDDSLEEGRWRAMGLSFGPVHLGYQVCLVFTIAMIWSRVKGTPIYALAAIGLIVLSSIVAGNRSPIVGALLALSVLMFVYGRRMTVMVTPLFLVLAVLLFDPLLGVLKEAGFRAATVDDGSAVGRQPLAVLGFLLFLDNPFGYGWTYNSKELWAPFWAHLKAFENSVVVQRFGLHNYFLNMLGKYGLFLLPLLAFLRMRWDQFTFISWAFIPYMVNAIFHNEGPFHGDVFIWFVLPCVIFYLRTSDEMLSEKRR